MKYCNRCGAPHEPGRCGRDSEDLRTRVAAVVSAELCRQQHAIDPHRVWQWFDMGPVADAVIRELGPIPDREFTDQWGHHWEWCGGVTGTWAWRITRLEQQ